jgi:hypothetical protein
VEFSDYRIMEVPMRPLQRLAVTGLAATLGVTSAFVQATPAEASPRECYSNQRKFSLPHKPDVTVLITLCVERAGSIVNARANVTWNGRLGYIGGKRFNDFIIVVRAERYDRVKKSASFNQTSSLNSQYSNTRSLGTYAPADARGGWSADGYVIVDIAGDGAGNYRWDLHGTPVVR